MKQKVIDFLKKYWKYALLILLIIIAISWSAIREGIIKRQTKKIVELEYDNIGIALDRNNLNIKLKKLQTNYNSIAWDNDSMKKVLAEKQKELKDLIVKHKKEIDELMNIPADTVFVRLQALYPNYDTSPVRFPFSATQIKPIYATSISFGMIKDEYSKQGENLKTCLSLNSGYESGIVNLNSQIGNLTENIKKADAQVGNYKSEIVILNKQVSRKSFWNRILWGISGISIGYAILK
jgi:peptidoglycan hydrolase CwlO-like protein